MTTRPTASKVLLVADGRAAADCGLAVPVRRFRLARMLPAGAANARQAAEARAARR